MTFFRIAFIQKFHKELIVAAISLWALYLRIQFLAHSQIDGDALWQVGFIQSRESFLDLLRLLPKADHAGYLAGDFVLIYPFFKFFGWNKWALSLPHLAITMAGYYFMYRLARDHFKTVWGYIVSFLVLSLNGNLIEHSVEVRAYAVMPTLALMVLYYALRVFESGAGMGAREKFWIGLVFVLTIWFHLYGILMVFCSLLYAALVHCRDERRRSVFCNAAKYFAGVFVVALPLWGYSILVALKLNMKAMTEARGMNTFDYIPNPLDLLGFLRAIFGNLMGFKSVDLAIFKIDLRWLIYGTLPALLLPHRERFRKMGFYLILIVLPLQLLFLMDLFNGYWYLQRQFVWVMAWHAFFLGWCWDSIAQVIIQQLKFKRQVAIP